MDPLKYRRALPVQLKILIPVSPDDRHRRLLASIREHFPPVSCRFFMTGLTDSEPSEASLTLRRDLETLTTEMLPDRYTHILIRTGNPVETILTTAVKQRCDLIILAHSNKLTVTFNNRQVRIKTLLRKTPLPILLVPDPPDTPSVTPIMPPQKIIIHLHPDEKNRLCSAFAMRCARLIQAPALLVSQSKPASEKQANDYLSFIRDRYWPLESPAACDVQCDTRKSTTLHALIRETGADMTILTCNDPGQRRRKQYIDQIKPLIDAPNHLILWVQRRDWVAGLEEKMRVIYKSLSDFELTTSKNKDAATQIPEPEMHVLDSSPQLLLGCYSMDGLEEVFRRYGLFDSFARRGYPGAHVLFDATDRHMDRLRVFPTRKIEGEPLVDLVFRREMMLPGEVFNNDGPPAEFPADLGPYLYIEWLCLQDPERSYRDLEIPLPGQRYPGLGLGWKVMIILKLLAHRIGAAGVYNMPEYYHTARLYHRYFHYIDPELEGRLLALDRDTFPTHLVDTSWAFLHDLVMENARPCHWIGGAQILPIHPALSAWFQSDTYRSQTHQSMNRYRFYLDRDRLRSMMSDRSLYRDPGDRGAHFHGGKL